jgi:hypothetical protein
MGTKTTWALVVAASAVTGTGAVRAQDAQQQTTTTRGSIVLPVGDKVHGYLRGGETHALQVHLAKGDVYSFDVNSNKRGDALLMHLELIDPSGHEITGDARVAYRRNGKRVTMGPYVAEASGTYVIELSAQSWFSGDYWGTSSVRGARKSVVHLPAGGATVDVAVAAGSTLRLRAQGVVRSFVIATPNAPTSELSGKDALVASLRGRGLAASETGTYQFGAKGAATIEVAKPRWKAVVVEVPTLPDDPTRLAQFDFVMNGWKEQNAAALARALEMQKLQASAPPTVVGAPVAVGALANSGTTASLFLGGAIDAVGDTSHIHEMPPSDGNSEESPAPPPVSPPILTPSLPPPSAPFEPHVLPPATEYGTPDRLNGAPSVPRIDCAKAIGTSVFGANWTGWRDAPWYRGGYFGFVTAGLLPLRVSSGDVVSRNGVFGTPSDALATESVASVDGVAPVYGDESDPFVVRTFAIDKPWGNDVEGSIVTTSRYYVDGHQVGAMLATGGQLVVQWTVSGSGTIDGAAWTIHGAWTMSARQSPDSRTTCAVSGEERYEYGSGFATESIVAAGPGLASDSSDTPFAFDTLQGTIRNELSVPYAGITQTMRRELVPAVVNYSLNSDGYYVFRKTIYVTTTTIDPSTPDGGMEDDTEYLDVLSFSWC